MADTGRHIWTSSLFHSAQAVRCPGSCPVHFGVCVRWETLQRPEKPVPVLSSCAGFGCSRDNFVHSDWCWGCGLGLCWEQVDNWEMFPDVQQEPPVFQSVTNVCCWAPPPKLQAVGVSWNIRSCSHILGSFLFAGRALRHKMAARRCCRISIFRIGSIKQPVVI